MGAAVLLAIMDRDGSEIFLSPSICFANLSTVLLAEKKRAAVLRSYIRHDNVVQIMVGKDEAILYLDSIFQLYFFPKLAEKQTGLRCYNTGYIDIRLLEENKLPREDITQWEMVSFLMACRYIQEFPKAVETFCKVLRKSEKRDIWEAWCIAHHGKTLGGVNTNHLLMYLSGTAKPRPANEVIVPKQRGIFEETNYRSQPITKTFQIGEPNYY